jgi:hypothetical protein
MKPGEDFRPETDHAAAAGGAGPGPVSRDARETGWEVVWGVWKVFIIILAAFLGAATVEAVRAIF